MSTPAPAVPPATTPAPAPSVSFLQYLEHHMPYGAKVAIAIAVIAAVVWGWNYVRDLRARDQQREQEVATLKQQFQQVGKGSAIAGNDVQGQKDLNAAAAKAIDPALLEVMRQQNAQILSLTQAVGMVSARVTALQAQPSTFAGKQDDATGALSGYTLEESRGPAPALTALSLFYDPRQRDPNLALKGSSWTHYTEEFHPVVSEWKRDKDGGYKTTLQLSRTIYKPTPGDPTQRTMVGTEQIPITGAETIFGPKAIAAEQFKIPRWTATIGVTRDGLAQSANGYQPAAFLDYRVTNRYGVTAGAANKGAFLGLSIRLGPGK